jgi:hypothetical protein
LVGFVTAARRRWGWSTRAGHPCPRARLAAPAAPRHRRPQPPDLLRTLRPSRRAPRLPVPPSVGLPPLTRSSRISGCPLLPSPPSALAGHPLLLSPPSAPVRPPSPHASSRLRYGAANPRRYSVVPFSGPHLDPTTTGAEDIASRRKTMQICLPVGLLPKMGTHFASSFGAGFRHLFTLCTTYFGFGSHFA